ncbi:dephospho-CoA kinase [Oryzihumus leptocrescens]|uniref:Dephospho-CoA kinase n=1 Tax=Oryzihumus leptocrescens TaxID=297536 RepID=A0A542ZK00_9MICO|nr:dephospho-CoA kinase [Oryzihumus leptocrescens]TQL60676.1 dephospho-CoA kinase [Oryzihumus leptocrescens]
MLRVGLSGGIGSGKSTVADRLRELGALVVDSDLLAREVVAPGSEGLAAVVERFGTQVLAADGSLDRAALGAIVFADDAGRRDLERITHPRIAARAGELVAAAPPEAVVVHDVPLLVEKHMGPGYHLVLIVDTDESTRIARLTSLRGLSEADAKARIAAQATDEQRRAAADVLLPNDGTVEQVRAAVDALWRERLVPFNDNLVRGRRSRGPEVPTLVGPDPSWPVQAARLVERIALALGERAVSVDHIGSTSVPGLVAKDVIDLQVSVRRLEDADDPEFVAALQRMGFPRVKGNTHDEPKPDEPGIALWRKRFHGSADPGRVAHVHVREVGSPGWRYALLFRDWLRADAGAREDYARVKRELAGSAATTTDYAGSKEPWFTQVWPRAEAWARLTGWGG